MKRLVNKVRSSGRKEAQLYYSTVDAITTFTYEPGTIIWTNNVNSIGSFDLDIPVHYQDSDGNWVAVTNT